MIQHLGQWAFANDWALLALALVPLLAVAARAVARRGRATARYSDVRRLRNIQPSLALRMKGGILFARLLALALLIVALARPQHGIAKRDLTVEGIDIYLALDVSGSMEAADFAPNRLEAAKAVLKKFVAGRKSDRIGVVVFATTTGTLVPLTLDYGVIDQFVDRVTFGIVNPNATAIGSALANAVKKLEDSDAKSKVVILLTDGESNAGKISPTLAADTAKALGVKVYTIGIGGDQPIAPRGFGGFFASVAATRPSIDEPTLRDIADKTGGMYFRATDARSLQGVFEEIDRLETTERELPQHVNWSDRMAWFVWPALLLLMGEILLGYTRFATLP